MVTTAMKKVSGVFLMDQCSHFKDGCLVTEIGEMDITAVT